MTALIDPVERPAEGGHNSLSMRRPRRLRRRERDRSGVKCAGGSANGIGSGSAGVTVSADLPLLIGEKKETLVHQPHLHLENLDQTSDHPTLRGGATGSSLRLWRRAGAAVLAAGVVLGCSADDREAAKVAGRTGADELLDGARRDMGSATFRDPEGLYVIDVDPSWMEIESVDGWETWAVEPPGEGFTSHVGVLAFDGAPVGDLESYGALEAENLQRDVENAVIFSQGVVEGAYGELYEIQYGTTAYGEPVEAIAVIAVASDTTVVAAVMVDSEARSLLEMVRPYLLTLRPVDGSESA